MAELEAVEELHLARILLLLGTFAGGDGTGRVEGLTKLAKLDFLLRYPVMLERALDAKHKSGKAVRVEPHERLSVESKMVRYRFGPWDHRYRNLLNVLVAKGFVNVVIQGRTISIGLSQLGAEAYHKISALDAFQDVIRRASILRANFDVRATTLVRFIYDTFPEVLSLRSNEEIPV